MNEARVVSLHRHPVEGLSAESLDEVTRAPRRGCDPVRLDAA